MRPKLPRIGDSGKDAALRDSHGAKSLFLKRPRRLARPKTSPYPGSKYNDV